MPVALNMTYGSSKLKQVNEPKTLVNVSFYDKNSFVVLSEFENGRDISRSSSP